MSLIISFIGIPASGKTYYGKKIAKKFNLPFLKEIGTEVILENGYRSAGFRLPYEFEEKVFEKNKKRINKTQKLLKKSSVVWESHMITDSSFLMGRSFFGDRDPRRFKLLQKYKTEPMTSLDDKTIFVILDMDPEISLRKQRERGNQQLTTPDLKLLQYVRESFLRFYNENKNRCILVDVNNKSDNEILKEIETKLGDFLSNE